MLKRILARLRAWLAWRAAKAEPSRINRPAPIPSTGPLSILKRRPATVTVAGAEYFRDKQGTLWRVRGVTRNAAGAFVYIVGKRGQRAIDPATGHISRLAA